MFGQFLWRLRSAFSRGKTATNPDGTNPEAGWRPILEFYKGQGKDLIPRSPERIVAQYRSWVYRCVSINAIAVASVPLRLYAAKRSRGTRLLRPSRGVSQARVKHLLRSPDCARAMAGAETVEEITEHPFVDLMANVNDGMNGFDAMELTQTYLDLVGEAYWLIEENGLGAPSAFYVLPSQHMKPKTDRRGALTHFVLGWRPNEIRYDLDEIIFFRAPSPLSRVRGYGPGHANYMGAKRNQNFEEYEDALFRNRARPDQLLVPEMPLDDAQAKKLVENFHRVFGGVAKAGVTGLAPFKVDVKQLAVSPRDLGLLASRKATKEETCNIFGVPLTKIDLSKSDASARQGDISYQADTVYPRCRRIQGKLNERMMPLYEQRPGVRLFCAFDNPVPPDRDYHLRRASAMASVRGVFRVNEVRSAFDSDPDDEIGGEVHGAGGGLAVAAPAAEPKALTRGTVLAKSATGLRDTLKALFREQRKAVLAALPKSARRRVKAAETFFDFDRWVERFADDTMPILEAEMATGAERGARRIGQTISWDVARPETQAFVQDYVYRFSASVNETTQAQLRKVFAGGLGEGMTTAEIAEAVEGVYDFAERSRAALIARTEATRALNAGEDQAWKDSDVVAGSYWDADPNACEFCLAMAARYGEDAEMVPLGGSFARRGDTIQGTDGGTMLLDYSDMPYPPLHPACRCTRTPVLTGEN